MVELEGVVVRTVGTVQDREDVVAAYAGAEDVQVEAPPIQGDGDTVVVIRNTLADVGHVTGAHDTVAVDIDQLVGTVLRVDAVHLVTVHEPDRIARLEGGAELGHIVGTVEDTGDGGIEIGDLVLERGEVRVDAVAQLADAVLPAEFELETLVVHVTAVDRGGTHADLDHRLDVHEQVARVLVIVVDTEGEAVVQEAGVETEVELLGGLPLQVGIRQTGRVGTVVSRVVVERVLIPRGVVVDGGGIRVVVQDVDVTVDTPGSTELQEGNGLTGNIVAEERLVGNGPTGGDGGEEAPALVGGKLGGVERIGTEVTLQAVAVVIAPHQTGEVGQVRTAARGVAEALGRRGLAVHVVHVDEVGLVTGEDVRTGGVRAHVVAAVLDEGHTGHGAEGVLAEVHVVVEEVLPLIVQAGVGAGGDGVGLGQRHRVRVVRCAVIVVVAVADAVTQAGGEHEALEDVEVTEHGAADAHAAARAPAARELDQR